MDQYDALVSGAPASADQQRALAMQLRRQDLMGQMYAATGDRVIAPLGQQMSEGAAQSAKEIGTQQEKATSLKQALAMHQDEMARYQASQAETARHNAADEANAKDMTAYRNKAEADRAQNAADMLGIRQQLADATDFKNQIAKEKAEKAAEGKILPAGAIKEISPIKDAMRGVDDTLAAFKAADAQGIQLGGPGRALKNAISANTPLGTQSMDAAQNIWANYGRQFTLPELKATIGVRHNEYMQNLFESYHLNPNMTNKQLIQNLQQISDQAHNKVAERALDYKSNGYNVGDYQDEIDAKMQRDAAKKSGPVAPTNAAAAALKTYANPPAPPAVPMAAPQGQMLPQANPQQPQGMNLPKVPGLTQGSMFTGLNP